MTTTSASASASIHLGGRPRRSIPSKRISRTSGAWWRWTKYSWKSSQPSSVRTCVRTGSSAIGRIAVGMPSAAWSERTAVGQGAALGQPRRPRDVGREVAVAEPEPGRLAVLGQAVHDGPGLAGETPAALVVEPARQHVHDRVVVGHDEQAVPLGVVARVGDDRQVARAEDGLEPVGQLRATGPAGQDYDDLHSQPLYALSALLFLTKMKSPPVSARSYGR